MQVDLAYLVPIAAVLIALYRWCTKYNEYFYDTPVPTMAAKPFFGSVGPLMFKRISFAAFVQNIYDKFSGVKVFGMFDLTVPVYVIRDPELIKQVSVTDFEHFGERLPIFGSSEHEHPNMITGKSLFALPIQRWKNMRTTLSPAFTGSKMRQMFDLLVECSESAARYYKEEALTKGAQEYEMKDVFARYTADAIATVRWFKNGFSRT